MANDRTGTDEQYGSPSGDSSEDRMRNGVEEDVRGVAEEEDDDFEDMDDLEDDEDDSDGGV